MPFTPSTRVLHLASSEQPAEPDPTDPLLRELRTPLAAGEVLLSLLADAVPASCRSTVTELQRNHDQVVRLCADSALLAELDAGPIARHDRPLDLRWWLDSLLAEQRERAQALGIELCLRATTCVPGEVHADADRWRQAIDGVLHVAMQRMQSGVLEVAVRYGDCIGPVPQLEFTVTARGGGFEPGELADVFRPFAVRDSALRPLLGLSVAQRIVAHVGGSLHVDSSGPLCSYALSLTAQPTEGALWVDPKAEPGHHLGPVSGGVVLLVGDFGELDDEAGAALAAAGYAVEHAAELHEADLGVRQGVGRYNAVIVDLRAEQRGLGSFVRSLRRAGCGALVLALVGPGSAPVAEVDGVDRVFADHAPGDLVEELRRLRGFDDCGFDGYRVRRNATNAC